LAKQPTYSDHPVIEREVYRFIVASRLGSDPRAAGLLADAHALGLNEIGRLECHDLFFLEGLLSHEERAVIAHQLLSDSITQTVEWSRFVSEPDRAEAVEKGQPWLIEVALRPGVTNPVADQIVRAAHQLGIQGLERAATGQRYLVYGRTVTESVLHLLARRLLSNPVIQHYACGEIDPVFPHLAEALGQVDTIPLRQLTDEGLLAVSGERRAALDLAEMRAIRDYFQKEGRDPTDVEFETIAQTWSEHCVHKTFKARIEVRQSNAAGIALDGEKPLVIDGLLKTYIRAATEQINAPWVRSAFIDNAGIIDFDDAFEVSFKVETHNHPSAIEPFGGANTGVGGVIRDVLGVSAKPIAATDILCFGPQNLPLEEIPEGVLHPRRIQSGVVAGVQDYGNKIGIPTVNGAILYDPGYTANPLVFCGCVGFGPKDSHPRDPQPGDRVIVLGGRTGRDGLRGATFSSQTMDAQTGEVAGASVQIGDPITEKGLIEVIMRARDKRLYNAITDCGAGGLSSAVGEMASQIGAEVELKDVRLKYPGLAPWEIWLSEAQERMVLAASQEKLAELVELCEIFEVELTDIGFFNRCGRLVVKYAGKVALDLSNEFLHNGIPQKRLQAVIPVEAKPIEGSQGMQNWDMTSMNRRILEMLAAPNTASKEPVIRIYDHEVQGGTVVKPLTGAANDGPSDACVLKPLGSSNQRGIVLANGINPNLGKRDAYRMAVSAVDEAIRNAVAVGADPGRIALLDNFCWGDPRRPETLGSLVEAARGCYDAALHYSTPFISGKDSLNNEYLGADGLRHAIPPSLLISAIGVVEDIAQTVTMDLKSPGSVLYLLGSLEGRWETVPGLAGYAPALYSAFHQAVREGLVRACHDLSEGGLSVAAAEMCIGGRLGLSLALRHAQPDFALFGDVNACLLVEVPPQQVERFEHTLESLPYQRIGIVTAALRLEIECSQLGGDEKARIDIDVDQLIQAWQGPTEAA
jgi:phosphoribosylformylglycinamidine synthase subunit PurSL